MKTIKSILILVIIIISYLDCYSQQPNTEKAKEYFKLHNYIDALILYVKLIEKDPENDEYLYKAGICVLNIANDKSDAIKYLKAASEKKTDPDVNFYLGKAYHYNLKFDEALTAYNNYKNEGQGTRQKEVDREIEMVTNAKKIVKSPINVSFENAGELINTPYPDYYPFVTPNESFMVFTSRKKNGAKEFDGYYPSNIYYSSVINGNFVAAKKASLAINSVYDDQAVGLSYNADKLYLYCDDIKNIGDIYEAEIKNFKFRKKIKMGESVNSRGFESAATVSLDGNTLFFASKRQGGIGGKDIYMTKKLPTGNWAEPQNLGNTINTPYDEDFPNLFYDGSTLYFSSKGHNSIGGYDYFKSNWDITTNTWSKPINLGYPINTPEDNVCISFTEDKRHAYVSRWRKDSKGFQDIYKVTFNDLDTRQTVIKSKIVKEGSSEIITDALIIVTDNSTQEKIGNYTPNAKNGNFIITLVPGNYNIMIDAPGYNIKSEDFVVKGKSDFSPFLSKKFEVSP